MRWKPDVTVAAIAERDQNFLLVEKSIDDRLVFNQPADHLDRNESLVDAVKREVLEETAWEFAPQSVVGIYLYPNQHSDVTCLRVCFSGNCDHHHPEQVLDDGIIQAVWLSKEDIHQNIKKMRSPMVLQCINDYLAGKTFPLNLLYHHLPDATLSINT